MATAEPLPLTGFTFDADKRATAADGVVTAGSWQPDTAENRVTAGGSRCDHAGMVLLVTTDTRAGGSSLRAVAAVSARLAGARS